MGLKALISGAFAAVLASTAMAQTLDPVRIEMFRSVLEGNQCVLTEAQAGNILPRFDFSRDETRAIVGALVAAGEVRLDGNTLNLVDGSCSSDDAVADLLGQRDVQQFIAVMAEYDCAMSEADGEAIFTARGMTQAQISEFIGPMIQAGMASFDSGSGVLRIDGAYCSPTPEVTAQAPVVVTPVDQATGAATEPDRSGMFAMTRVRGLVDAMAQNGCRLNLEVADGYLADAEIEHSFASFIARKMLSDGYATMADDQNLLLSEPYCYASGGAVVEAPTAPEAPVEMSAPAETAVPVAENNGSLEGLFLSVMAQNGCSLAEPVAQELFPAAGLRMDQAYLIADALVASGDASYSDDGAVLQISSSRCAQSDGPATPSAPEPTMDEEVAIPVLPVETPVTQPEPVIANPSDPRAGVLAVLAANNCEITQQNASAMLTGAGLELGPSLQILTQMMASGEATTPDGGQTLQVPAPLCVATSMAAPMTPRDIFINLIKQNNCSITASEFSALLPVDGLDASTAFGMIAELEAEGVISLPATRDIVTLSAENCR